ncbi:PREDICTED: PQ-loop repeat-containing protein 1 [Ceratosolen solmsi marchali]|uniref:Solute carrier family 66 member 2 n=1 Tax=Ceratosolen solmsi marchali TaxID=326594 RepID=A0AAJ6YWU4_9HYME|nr:PREDICTED: PQ-loop repeat-containing protein 1 [Ceratosolen solmsi marchali]
MLETYEELTIKNVAGWIASAAMVFGGIIPFVPQYKKIKQKEDIEGFSLYVCLTLLIANTLRILFWFGRHFELPLLIQSILMIATMLFMIRICINIKNKHQLIKQKDRIFTDFESKFFWKWTDFQSYVDFMLLFAFAGAVMMYLLIDVPIFVELIGLFALLTEAMLGLPQFIRNFSNKSTEGMSIAMVMMWTIGDIFKTLYFIQQNAPVQFELCGGLQILIDLAILFQVQFYKNNTVLIRPIARID